MVALVLGLLISAGHVLAAPLFEDDFSSGNLDAWNVTNVNTPVIVNEELLYVQRGFYGNYPATSKESFQVGTGIELSFDLVGFTINNSRTEENRLDFGLADAEGNMVLGARWAFTNDTAHQNNRMYYGEWAKQHWAPSWFEPGDVMGIRVTQTSLELLKNGSVMRQVDHGLDLSEAQLKLYFLCHGPNDGGNVTLDNVTLVPEPATMALMGMTAVVMTWRRRARR